MSSPKRPHALCLTAVLTCLFCAPLAFSDWIKVATPPDVDKDSEEEVIDCWLITSANMLAAAGYGPSDSLQLNAAIIHRQLKQEFPPTGG